MKKKNKGRKSLTAVGAVVAAGLTPGIVTGSPASPAPGPEVELTAADVVAINGDVFDFDELFAMRQINRDQRNNALVYGPPPSMREKEEKERQEALREEARQDSIRRAEKAQARVYGPPPVIRKSGYPEIMRQMAADNKEAAINQIQNELVDLVANLLSPDRIPIMLDSDLSRDLNMNPEL